MLLLTQRVEHEGPIHSATPCGLAYAADLWISLRRGLASETRSKIIKQNDNAKPNRLKDGRRRTATKHCFSLVCFQANLFDVVPSGAPLSCCTDSPTPNSSLSMCLNMSCHIMSGPWPFAVTWQQIPKPSTLCAWYSVRHPEYSRKYFKRQGHQRLRST